MYVRTVSAGALRSFSSGSRSEWSYDERVPLYSYLPVHITIASGCENCLPPCPNHILLPSSCALLYIQHH